MIRIRALNEDDSNSSSNDEEPEVTREAQVSYFQRYSRLSETPLPLFEEFHQFPGYFSFQETIACSEYVRALTLKRQGEAEPALRLFQDLLETQVLHNVTDPTKKLYSIRYNCLRNASFLLEDAGDLEQALHYVKEAILMDDTDIYTLNKAGQLALHFKEADYAMCMFQRCQDFNPNHWPSADGILRVLCLNNDFMGAYGWAIHWHQLDETYERAISVLLELHEQFQAHIPMFEE